MSARPGLVVFDLDGTLIDSSAWLLAAVNRVLAPYAERPWGIEELLATAGGPERLAFAGVVPPRDLDAVLERYRAALRRPGSLRAQPGVEELLGALEGSGIAMSVFSGAGRVLGELRLELLGWQGRFDVCVWGDETEPKPSPRGLIEVLRRTGCALDAAVFVGDTEKDALAAKAAGMRFIGVAWGDRPGGPRNCDVVHTAEELLVRLVG